MPSLLIINLSVYLPLSKKILPAKTVRLYRCTMHKKKPDYSISLVSKQENIDYFFISRAIIFAIIFAAFSFG